MMLFSSRIWPISIILTPISLIFTRRDRTVPKTQPRSAGNQYFAARPSPLHKWTPGEHREHQRAPPTSKPFEHSAVQKSSVRVVIFGGISWFPLFRTSRHNRKTQLKSWIFEFRTSAKRFSAIFFDKVYGFFFNSRVQNHKYFRTL